MLGEERRGFVGKPIDILLRDSRFLPSRNVDIQNLLIDIRGTVLVGNSLQVECVAVLISFVSYHHFHAAGIAVGVGYQGRKQIVEVGNLGE